MHSALGSYEIDYELMVCAIDQNWPALDFSCYEHFVNNFEGNLDGYDKIIFANDTLFKKYRYRYYLRSLAERLKSVQSMEIPIIVGEIHEYNTILIEPSDPYISTFVFGVNSTGFQVIKKLFPLLSEPEFDHKLKVLSGLVVNMQPQFQSAVSALKAAKSRAIYFERKLSREFLKDGIILSIHRNNSSKFVTKILNKVRRVVS